MLYLCRHVERMGWEWDARAMLVSVTDHYHRPVEQRGTDFVAYWQPLRVGHKELASFAIMVAGVVADEAEVERNFCAEARVLGSQLQGSGARGRRVHRCRSPAACIAASREPQALPPRRLSSMRTRMADEQRRAELHIMMNYAHYYDPETAAAREAERQRRNKYSAARAEKFYALLDAELDE